jgi:hypothetical protein
MLRKRSVLITETVVYQSPNDPNNLAELVTSTSALIYNNDNQVYYYNPTGVVQTVKGTYTGPGTHTNTGIPVVGAANSVVPSDTNNNNNSFPVRSVYCRPDPFSLIEESGPDDGSSLNAAYLESKQGTLFFYETSD